MRGGQFNRPPRHAAYLVASFLSNLKGPVRGGRGGVLDQRSASQSSKQRRKYCNQRGEKIRELEAIWIGWNRCRMIWLYCCKGSICVLNWYRGRHLGIWRIFRLEADFVYVLSVHAYNDGRTAYTDYNSSEDDWMAEELPNGLVILLLVS